MTKLIFVSCAKGDEGMSDVLQGQYLDTQTLFEYIDVPADEMFRADWQERARERICRSQGMIALVSENTLKSSAQWWQIRCAREECKDILGVWAYSEDRTAVAGLKTIPWYWEGIVKFIDTV